MKMVNHPNRPKKKASEAAVHMGRAHIAKLARADGEHIFAREVEGGCWDHRDDVASAIAEAGGKE